MKHTVILLTVIMLTACSSAPKSKSSMIIDINAVKTEAGLVSGVPGGDGTVKIFRGIPFAAPPLGDLRWKAPAPLPHWEGIRKCDVFPPSAMQSKPTPFAMWSKEFMAPEEPLSEDCLYLNLWTAAKTSDERRPVIVWIHGGAFTSGSGSVPLYDGEEMAKKGVVFITINYRLGLLGFLAHPELSQESPNKVSGNYGILDQIAALLWVKSNVVAFGGDPDRVTIAGQSAGSFSVNALVISPLAKGLFHRAIAQSGSMFSSDRLGGSGLTDMEKQGVGLLKRLNIPGIAELRTKPADELIKAGAFLGLTIDDYVLINPSAAYAAGKQNDVPLLTGWNAGDNLSFASPLKAADFIANAEKKYGERADEFLRLFPAGTDEEAKNSQEVLGMLSFGGTNYTWARVQCANGKNPVYLYFFSHVPPGLPNYGAFHSAEFGYALKTLKYWDRPFTDYDHQLSETMSSFWVNFAVSGNPNGKGLPEWTTFDPGSPRVMEFGDRTEVIDLPFQAQLNFLNQF
ncbi:MAG: carboxylesterase family protein [Bacteroidales bacterium]|nr:carboxylesterase family protein [Bacteroidales bacterium]